MAQKEQQYNNNKSNQLIIPTALVGIILSLVVGIVKFQDALATNRERVSALEKRLQKVEQAQQDMLTILMRVERELARMGVKHDAGINLDY